MQTFKTIFPLFRVTKAHSTSTEKKNIAGLDGLRAFAALGVVVLHTTYLIGHAIVNEYAYPWLASFWVFGNTGVQLFFVLSGFLLFLPYAKALVFQEKWPSIRTFYLRRVLRILPGYYFSLFLLLIFVQHVYITPDHWPQLFLFLTFFMDSSQATFQQINVPYWSLGVEVQFYLFLPFVALGIHAFVQRVAHAPQTRLRAALLACVGIMFIGLAIRYVGLQLAQLPQGGTSLFAKLLASFQFLFFGVSGKYWEDFAIGMFVSLCYMYAQHPTYGQQLRQQGQRWSLSIGLCALSVLILAVFWNFRRSYPTPQLNFILPLVPYNAWLLDFVASLGWGLLIATIVFGNALFQAPFESRLMRWIGTISYSVYLWHLPLLSVFKKYIFPHFHVTNIVLSFCLYGAFFALVVIPWCVLVYWYVERPFMLLKDRRKPLRPSQRETIPEPSQLVTSGERIV